MVIHMKTTLNIDDTVMHRLREAEEGEGPAHLMLIDPDGNPVLIDQN